MKKERPPVTERDINKLIKGAGFNYHTLCGLERAGWCIKAEDLGDIPETPHFQVIYEDLIRSHSGYENDSGTLHTIFRIWVFDEEDLWKQAAQAYFEDAVDMESPTNTASYSKGPMKIVFLAC